MRITIFVVVLLSASVVSRSLQPQPNIPTKKKQHKKNHKSAAAASKYPIFNKLPKPEHLNPKISDIHNPYKNNSTYGYGVIQKPNAKRFFFLFPIFAYVVKTFVVPYLIDLAADYITDLIIDNVLPKIFPKKNDPDYDSDESDESDEYGESGGSGSGAGGGSKKRPKCIIILHNKQQTLSNKQKQNGFEPLRLHVMKILKLKLSKALSANTGTNDTITN